MGKLDARKAPVGTWVKSCLTAIAFPILCAVSLGGCAGSLVSAPMGSSLGSGTSGIFTPVEVADNDSMSALSKAADKYTSAATPGDSAYKIGPGDVIEISVFKVPDLSKTLQVGGNGLINSPLAGELLASGKTAHELEIELTRKLSAKYIQSPQVSVFVREYNSQRVTVDGSIKHPGVYSLKGHTTLLQVLAMASGIDTTVASGEVVVFRRIDGKRSAARFDVATINEGKAEDPELYPDDVVVVDRSATKVAIQTFMNILPAAGTAAGTASSVR
jgi:polysaccharide biosynthesis/export protein